MFSIWANFVQHLYPPSLPWPLPPFPSSCQSAAGRDGGIVSSILTWRPQRPGVFRLWLVQLDRKLKSSYDLKVCALKAVSGWLELSRRLRYHSCNSSHVRCRVSFLWSGGCVWQLLLLAPYLKCAAWLFDFPLCFCCCFCLSLFLLEDLEKIINAKIRAVFSNDAHVK